jgi:predicted nucleic acid-binding Zn ribbon protein
MKNWSNFSDYTGYKFHALTVLHLVGTVKHGRNNVKIWLCECVCGKTLEVDQASLIKGQKPACKTCRRGPCVICGAPIENDDWGVKRNTCSDKCQHDQTKARHRKRYYKLIELDPDHNKKRHKARQLADPLYEKKRYQLRLKRLNALPEKQRQALIKKQNEYTNLWRSAYVKKLKIEDPEAYIRYRKAANAYYRRWYRENKKRVTND